MKIFSFRGNLSHVYLRGMDNIIEKLHVVSEDETMVEMMWPEIKMYFDYAVEGSFGGVLPFHGDGHMQ